MSTEIIVSVISLLGTIVGSLGGVLVSSRLTTYRIQKLEERVAKHNNLIGGGVFSIFKSKEDETMKSIWVSIQLAFSALGGFLGWYLEAWTVFSTR